MIAALALMTLGASSFAAESAVPFRKVSFEEATQAAKTEQKLVFVDFYTTWCEPCKRLDADTFSNASVGQLVGEKAVALKLDAEKEGRETAKRYKVSSYPTLLVTKADGTEVDRIIGYREPAAFKKEFAQLVAMAAGGKSGIEVAKDAVAKADDDEEAKPRFELAVKLARSGDYETATRELLWCWDEGKKDPEFSRFMRSRVPAELARIGRDYPAALAAMRARRDQTRERVLANKGGDTATKDLIELNKALGFEEDTLVVMDQLPEDDRRRVTLSIYLSALLIEKKRYKEAMTARQVTTAIQSLERAFTPDERMAKLPPEALTSMRASALRMAASMFEGYVGAGKDSDARLLAEKMLTLDSSPATRELLTKHATRAGQPDWIAKLPAAPAK